jgi:hypothetical protein
VYVVTGKITPKKSGTVAHPRPIATTIAYTTRTIPKGQRPNVVSKLVITIAGVRGNTNAFPTCSTSRLNNPKQGPGTCPKNSLVGRGFFIADIGPSNTSTIALTCREDLSIYNGGGGSLSYYAFVNPAAPKHCPTSTPALAFAVHVREAGTTLIQTINVPPPLRHPATGFDAAVIQATATIGVKTRKVHGKTVGLGESIFCPVNHKRHISIKFTLENGKSQTATANVPCT